MRSRAWGTEEGSDNDGELDTSVRKGDLKGSQPAERLQAGEERQNPISVSVNDQVALLEMY